MCLWRNIVEIGFKVSKKDIVKVWSTFKKEIPET
jgi:hypothetical protein